MEIDKPLAYAGYILALIWIFTTNEIIFKLTILVLLMSIVNESLKPDKSRTKQSKSTRRKD